MTTRTSESFTLTFKPENDLRYGSDRGIKHGIPAGVRFAVLERKADGLWLAAPGYGGRGTYGAGPLFVPFEQEGT